MRDSLIFFPLNLSTSFEDFLKPSNLKFSSAANSSILSTRLFIALCELLFIPTFFLSLIKFSIILAEVYVLPAPGGPWINKKDELSFLTALIDSLIISFE